MWKYLATFALIFVLAVYVSIQDKLTAQQSAQQSAHLDKGADSAKTDENRPQENVPDTKRDTPSWYNFFRWPDGVTTWAIILTLLAIAEQTKLTAKAVEVANKTLISTLRPRLIIRNIEFHRGTQIPTVGAPDADPWKVNFEVSNIGQGFAHILEWNFAVSRIDSRLPTKTAYMKDDAESKPFTLEPGEEMSLSIHIDQELTSILRLIGLDGLAHGYQNTDHIYFFGSARYTDDLGTARNIMACRLYHNASLKFKAVDDPDREYWD
jgi:hypothetical protein